MDVGVHMHKGPVGQNGFSFPSYLKDLLLQRLAGPPHDLTHLAWSALLIAPALSAALHLLFDLGPKEKKKNDDKKLEPCMLSVCQLNAHITPLKKKKKMLI